MANTVQFHSHEISLVKAIDTESREVVTKSRGEGSGELECAGFGAPVWEDERSSGNDSGVMVQHCECAGSHGATPLKMVKIANFISRLSYHNVLMCY